MSATERSGRAVPRLLLPIVRVAEARALAAYASKRPQVHNLGGHALLAANEFRLHRLGWLRGSSRSNPPVVEMDASLPPLAWLAHITPLRTTFTVGSGVEKTECGIFEGVWDGDFDRFRPDLALYAFGSGAVWNDRRVTFVPPRHLEECLFALQRVSDSSTWVSNSLVFLLVRSGVAPGTPFFDLVAHRAKSHALHQSAKGVDRIWPLVAEDGEHRLVQCSYFNFSLGHNGLPRRHWFPATEEFCDYAQYTELLRQTTGRLLENGRSESRKRPLTPIAAVSTGYDSSAVAAIAAQEGCTQAVTLDVEVMGHHDNGSQIARSLGLDVTVRSHIMGVSIADLEAESAGTYFDQASEFFATFGIGDDVTYLAFEADVPGTMLLTGTWGDSIWQRDVTVPSGLPVRVPFGKSLAEFRLRTGFAHLPVPFIGGRFSPSAARLAHSAEMQPYCVGGDYDRPIPRRIAESAGVPREAFGVRKCATAPLLQNHDDLFAQAVSRTAERYLGSEMGSET